MKNIALVSLLLTGICAWGQNKNRETEVRDYFWKSPSSEFCSTIIPEKWENESAVILASSFEYKTGTKGMNVYEQAYIHRRIKLLDYNSVKEYSDFTLKENKKRRVDYFISEKVNYILGIKIIKPNGIEQVISMDDAVKKDLQEGVIKRIAVSNLQIGDIIDFYYVKEHMHPYQPFIAMTPYLVELDDEYPVVYQTYKVELSGNTFLNAKSINGAPKLELVKKDNNIFTYELVDKNRNRVNTLPWINYGYQSEMLKFQVYYSTSPTYVKPGFASFYVPLEKQKDYLEFKNLVPLSLFFKMEHLPSSGTMGCVVQQTLKYLQNLNTKKPLSTEELVREGYYFMREYWYMQPFFEMPQLLTFDNSIEQLQMTFMLSNILMIMKHEHEIMFVPTVNNTRNEDLLFMQELIPGIKTIGENPVIVLATGSCNNVNEIPVEAYGADAYVINHKKKLSPDITRFRLPDDKASNHTSQIQTNISIDPDNDDVIRVKAHFVLKGAEKRGWDSVLFVSNIIQKDFDSVKYQKFIHRSLATSPFYKECYLNNQLKISEKERERVKLIKQKLIDLYHISDVDVKSLNIQQYGRFEDKSEMIFDVEFTVGNLLVQMGNNLMFPIGKFVIHRDAIDLSVRNQDVWMPYPHMIDQKLTFTATSNMALEGVDQLKSLYDSEDLKFESIANLDNDTLTIQTSEWIKQSLIKKENWKSVCDFHNTMNEFNNKKLIIKL